MGTSTEELENPESDKDHPHAYGDKPIIICSAAPVVGSSPRVWGQVGYLHNGLLQI